MPFNIFRKKKKKEEGVKKRPQITKEMLLMSKPVRNPTITWEKYPSGEIAVKVKIVKKGKRRDKVYEKKYLLDEVGSFVWNMCDGKHTVNDIISALMEKYKLHRREAEASLLQYLNMLSQRMLIGFMLPKDIIEKASTEETGVESST
ncbi:MAG TPA: PqqD family protein [Thermoprotei archaeon]|nr:PqqD family protein [Thermoprotei archaeon]